MLEVVLAVVACGVAVWAWTVVLREFWKCSRS